MSRLDAVAIEGLPEFAPGDDLATIIAEHARTQGIDVHDDDILVVASKVVAKVEDRFAPATEREEALASQTVRQVAARSLDSGRTSRVVQTLSGPVLVAAGIDSSDVPAAPDGTERVLLLPADPNASARRLREGLRTHLGAAPAVLVTDTAGRPWRAGVVDFALGAAGLVCLDDKRGTPDRDGRVMTVTVRATADEIASLADLVKGKAAGTPIALVRGLSHLVTAEDGAGTADLVRSGPSDWFALGADEAVRAALGLSQGPGVDDVPAAPIEPLDGSVHAQAIAQALAIARAGDRWPDQVTCTATNTVTDEHVIALAGKGFGLGVAVERIRTALWTVGLQANVPPGARAQKGYLELAVSPADPR